MEVGEIFNAIFSMVGMFADLFKAQFLQMAYILIILYNLNTILNSKKFNLLSIILQIIILYSLVNNSDEINLSVNENTWVSRITLGFLPFYTLIIFLSELIDIIKNKTKNKI
ncbi:hypothetical protein EG359_22405 (plasmid) [Chryseobacterium joostei]|uniref:Uncharacterized protein n=1 Tax=Chryseobacterium joostei TaxID=112234 RepID=A0A1N7KGV2_9FLAO|nr:hypothetical protein EG359_22405 [Chryseobacterium joostei]SIS60832.1 hypothetical protein SAMN05421768_11228 [Chryseobacterium joostei]